MGHSKDASRVQTSLSGFHPFTVELRCDLAILEHRASFRGDRTLEETRRSFESAPAQLASDLILDSGAHSPKELASSVVTALSNIQEIQVRTTRCIQDERGVGVSAAAAVQEFELRFATYANSQN